MAGLVCLAIGIPLLVVATRNNRRSQAEADSAPDATSGAGV